MSHQTLLAAGSPEGPQIAAIDFAKYRTGDLAAQLTELISVPEAFRKVLRATLLLAAFAMIACYLIHEYSQITLLPLLGVCSYTLAAALVFGLMLGVLRVVMTALENIESILRIVLETTGKVAKDYEQLQLGNTSLPPAGVLVEQVYQGVVLPVTERSIAKVFGVLERPVLYTYRMTIGNAVSYLVKRMSRATLTSEGARDIAQAGTSGLAAIAKYSETIRTYTSSAAELVGQIGTRIRRYAMVPAYSLFFLALGTSSIPLLLVHYFASR